MSNQQLKNKIIFTQDVPGERDWVNSLFPEYTNLETSSSGKWLSTFPKNDDQSSLYEIAYSDYHKVADLLNCGIDRTKSFYGTDPLLVFKDNNHWACSDDFISNVEYQPFVDKPSFLALNLARSGTAFVENLLRKFRLQHRRHSVTGTYSELVDIWREAKDHPDVALVIVYRQELWESLVSNVLGWHHGFHHRNEFDWSLVKPVAIDTSDMLQFEEMVISTLNFWCNLRSLLPTHSFLLLDGMEMIRQYKDIVDHSKVSYNKRDLVSNYSEAREKWYSEFNENLSRMFNNAIGHLKKMNCKQNLDHLL
jgi:hypothetical protein